MTTSPEALLQHEAVQRVQAALKARGSSAEVIPLATTARTAQDAANSLGCELGAIVKSLVFLLDGEPVMALVAGDRRCDTEALAGALGSVGFAKQADAETVRAFTGFSIGGVAPVGHKLPVAIDLSLGRFETIYAAAGHPHCVFPCNLEELQSLTDGALAPGLGTQAPAQG